MWDEGMGCGYFNTFLLMFSVGTFIILINITANVSLKKHQIIIGIWSGIMMSSTGNLILAIIWIFTSPLWFFSGNTVMGTIWLCGGIVELIIGLVRRSKEK